MKTAIRLLFLIFLLASFKIYSQSKIEKIIIDLNNNLKTYAADPKLQKVYLNRSEKILDIQDYKIPLDITTISYKSESRVYAGVKIVGNIAFRCEENCIIDENNDRIIGVAFAYKSKDGAYKFLDLIYKLKLELEK